MNLTTRFLIVAGTIGCFLALSTVNGGGRLLKKNEIPKAIQILKTGNAEQKAYAAKRLGERGAVRASDVKGAIQPLRILLAKDNDEMVRAAAAKALGQIGLEPQETGKMLLEVLKKDKSDRVKMATMIAIGSLGPKGNRMAIPELRKIARNKDAKRLRRTARMVLKEMRKQSQ